MKKKLILYLTGGLILIIGIAITIIYFAPANGTLYVNGKEVTSKNVKIYSDYADLPFIEVLKALGINVEWVDNSTAEFTCNGKKYTLDLDEETLKRDGSDFNGLIAAPGSTFSHIIVLEKELVIDSNTLLDNMYAMKNSLRVNIDHEKSIVYLTEPDD